jgi:Uma2 family endonuclease
MAMAIQTILRRSPEIPSGMTYEEFLGWLDEGTRAEWVDGQVILMSPALYEHQLIVAFLLKVLSEFAAAHDSGEVIAGPFQMKLPVRPSGREPDVLFVAKDRCGLIHKTYLDGAADLVVEVISTESRGRDTLDKREEYEQSGVREYWLVDPERHELTVFHRKGRRFIEERLVRGRFESALLPGLWLEVDWLWRKRLPSLQTALHAWGKAEAS